MNSPAPITLEDADTVLAIISLGANLPSEFGSPRVVVEQALLALQLLSETPVQRSSCYLTAALDCPPDAPDFINAIALLRVSRSLDAASLLCELHRIEANFGRQRGTGLNQPRSLDLDLISFGTVESQESTLRLPHPRAHERRFVLAPLAELAPGLRLPGHARTVSELLALLGEDQVLRRL
jgi:2-amino-4-hydroxy-6-hydroxymethyldihydropteridine diphosphokinase